MKKFKRQNNIEDIKAMMAVDGKKTLIRDYIKTQTGIILTTKDLANEQQKSKKKNENDIQEAVKLIIQNAKYL